MDNDVRITYMLKLVDKLVEDATEYSLNTANKMLVYGELKGVLKSMVCEKTEVEVDRHELDDHLSRHDKLPWSPRTEENKTLNKVQEYNNGRN